MQQPGRFTAYLAGEFAEGCNIGVAMAPRDASHILLLNTDTEVREDLFGKPRMVCTRLK